jgi:hypothetical protein
MTAQSPSGPDILPDGRSARRWVAQDTLHLPDGGTRRGTPRNGLPGRGLALKVSNRAANNRGHRPDSRAGNAPAAENARQYGYTADHVAKDSTQGSPVLRGECSDHRRSRHCLSMAFVLLVRCCFGHHFRQGFMMG